MQHCGGGPGAVNFGQGYMFGDQTNTPNDTSHNIVLALVDWVEGRNGPDVLIGSGKNGSIRTHCRYPHESRWSSDISDWVCT